MQNAKPTKAGAYWVKSDEIENEWLPVEIVAVEGVLLVDDPYLGMVDLDAYHDGLINIEWRQDGQLHEQ